jgi:hypothetical protein
LLHGLDELPCDLDATGIDRNPRQVAIFPAKNLKEAAGLKARGHMALKASDPDGADFSLAV